MDVYHWRDIEVTALAWPQSHFVPWRVATIVTVDEKSGSVGYTGNGAVNSMDLVWDPEQAEVLVRGTVKWDGCADLAFDEHAMTHLCGFDDLQRFHAVMTRMYEMTSWYLGQNSDIGRDRLPEPKHWPSQLTVVDGALAPAALPVKT